MRRKDGVRSGYPALVLRGFFLITVTWSAVAAYTNYYDPADPDEGGNCKACHSQFDQRGDLHDQHVGNSAFTSNCNICHKSNGDNPILNEGIAAGFFFACAGCHGNDYGKRDAGGNVVAEGYNLRWRHVFQNGVSVCLDCHDVGDTEPFPESIPPPHYNDPVTPDVSITGPCNSDGSEDGDESWKSPDPEPESEGLDNDGDGLYDGADPDCNRAGLARIVNVKAVPGTDDTLFWTASPDALQYQVLRGSLNDLKANSGSFANALCADAGVAGNSYQELLDPSPGDGWYFLVRGLNGTDRGTYESDGPGQIGSRDTTATACP